MNLRDEKVYRTALEVIHGRLTLAEFSLLIDRSYRQCQRIIVDIQAKGMLGVKHGNLGKVPSNKSPSALKEKVQRLMRKKYFDFNLTHLAEKLMECEGIQLKRETLRRWAHEKGTPKKAHRRRSKRIHQLRPRMPRHGMLIQFDGSDHDWFSGAGPRAVLVGGIDDATGEVLWIEFFPAEDTFSCLKVMRHITEKYGIPEAYYLDQAGHFGKRDSEQDTTQVGRALQELGVNVILASTPQAKGRIERLWGTLQDRLVAELRIHQINRIPRANDFLGEFMSEYNGKFAITPKDSRTAFRPLNPDIDLLSVFCIKEKRKVTAGQVFSYGGETY